MADYSRITLYHGSDHSIPKPELRFGHADNDYGQGFYMTADKRSAGEWACVHGDRGKGTYINVYTIDTAGLTVINLNDYGTLAWIAEIAANRGTRDERAEFAAEAIVEKYRIDTTKADLIIGYRADDSYLAVVEAFLTGEINIDETDRLFREGKLGNQYFLKSERSFEELRFEGTERIDARDYENRAQEFARHKVSDFLDVRRRQISLERFSPSPFTVDDALHENLVYDSQYKFYMEEAPDRDEHEWEEDDYER